MLLTISSNFINEEMAAIYKKINLYIEIWFALKCFSPDSTKNIVITVFI